MTIIYEIENIKITKEKNGNFLIKSDVDIDIWPILTEFFTLTEINSENGKEIKADKIESLKTLLKNNEKKLDYMVTLNLLYSLEKMKIVLEKSNLMFTNIDIDDIVVIDSSKFLFINMNKVFTYENEEITVERIIKKSDFVPKEMSKKEVPLKINIRAVYYNIGSLLTYCILNTVIKEKDDIEEKLWPIYYTKLYWFLLRCLDKEESKRIFLFI